VTGPRPPVGLGLPGPRRPQHILGPDRLAAMALPLGDDGVVVGTDDHGAAAVLGLFRPRAYEVLLVGGVWTAQLLALRAAATGARVVVETARGPVWTPVAQAAGGGQPCVTVHPVGRIGPQGATVAAPVLVVRDCGSRPARGRPAAGPWQTTLTLLPFLGPGSDRLLTAADLAGLQRVAPPEAELAGRVLRLAAPETAALPGLGDGVTLWCDRRRARTTTVRSAPTPAEARLLGRARRID
jgi:hypothetical protein